MNIKFDRDVMDTIPTPISQEFKHAVRKHPETLLVICEKTGINNSRLSRILNGRELPSRGDAKLIKIAEYINFPVDQIFGS